MVRVNQDAVVREGESTESAKLGELHAGDTVRLLSCCLAGSETKSGAKFEVAMSAEQRAAFETALVEEFETIKGAVGKVDVRECKSRNEAQTQKIVDELDLLDFSPLRQETIYPIDSSRGLITFLQLRYMAICLMDAPLTHATLKPKA